MRIAQIAPLIESVPPKLYGGTERAISYLTEELIRQGHDVTLFATGDSVTSARLVSSTPQGLRLLNKLPDAMMHNKNQMDNICRRLSDFDILHFHMDFSHFQVLRDNPGVVALTTMHGRLDIQAYLDVLSQYLDLPFVSISHSQRGPLLQANWVANVPHGLPRDLYSGGTIEPKGYLAFLGRICVEKGIEPAIEIANRSGLLLKIAAKIDPTDQDYFNERVRPLLARSPRVEYIGEIGDGDKQEFLGNAQAVLFPITWPEPFGLVMIEAMACGASVIAYDLGSVREIIEDGVTGFIVEGIDAAVAAIGRTIDLDCRLIRGEFEKRFTVEREASDYVKIYESLLMRN